MTVVAAGVERPVKLVGVTEGFQQIRRLVVFRGRYFDPDDMMTHAKVCLLTQELAARVFPNQNPVGQEIRVGELRFAVIGVFRERISTFGETEIARESVLVPFGLMTYYTGADYLRTLYVQADSPEAVPAVTQQVREILKSRHRPGAEYEVENLTSLLGIGSNDFASIDGSPRCNRAHSAHDQRHRHHEHHARHCHRAHARDWYSQSRGSSARRDPLPVSDGSIPDQRDRSGDRDCDRRFDSCRNQSHLARDPRSGRDSYASVMGFGGVGLCRVVLNRHLIWLPARESGGQAASNGIAAI